MEAKNKIFADLDLPLVSVIMPWGGNAPGFFNGAVFSVLNQTYQKFELLIVTHDLSLFNQPEVNQENLRDPRVKKILAEDLTDEELTNKTKRAEIAFPKILNTGIKYAKGQLIARHDADDISLPDRFEKQVNLLRLHPFYDFIGTGMQCIDMEGKPLYLHIPPIDIDEIVEKICNKDNLFIHGSIMARAEVLKENKYYYDPFGSSVEDYELWSRLIMRNGSGITNIQEPLYKYRANPSGIIRQMGDKLNKKRKWVQKRYGHYRNWTQEQRKKLKKQKILHYLVTLAIGGAEVHTANMIIRATYNFDLLLNNVLPDPYGGEILKNKIQPYPQKQHYATWERGNNIISEYDALVMSYLSGGQEIILREMMKKPRESRPTVILVNYVTRDLQFPNPPGANVDFFIKRTCGDPPEPICDYMLVAPESVQDWQYLFPQTTVIPFKIGAKYEPEIDKVKVLEQKYKADGRKTIMMVGRCGIEKGHFEVIPIVSELQKIMDEPFQLLILGRYLPEQIDRMKRDMAENNISEDKIVICGQVDPDEVSNYLALADIFVHTSPVETYPVALIEEAMTNKPIVVRYNPDAPRKRERYAQEVEHVRMIAEPYITTRSCARQLKMLLAENKGNKGYEWILQNNDFENCLQDLDQKIVDCIMKGH